jgi:excisionase family DNA binding protein
MSLRELVTSNDRKPASTVADKFRDFSLADTQLISARSLSQDFTPSRVADDEGGSQGVRLSATLTVPEAARLLGIGRNLAYEIAARDGEIAGVPVVRVGRRLLIPLARLLEVLGLDEDSTRFDLRR